MGAIFKSRQVNLDPTPWVYALMGPATDTFTPAREATQITGGFAYRPRPEFEPTRDPRPWLVSVADGSGLPDFRAASLATIDALPHREKFDLLIEWAPRREEFDTPVNRLLLEFRRLWAGQVDMLEQAAEMAYNLGDHDYLWELTQDTDYAPAEVEHARKVLERLAGWDA